MTGHALLITPTSSPAFGEEWSRLSPSERLQKLQEQDHDLDRALRERLRGMTLDYLGGVRSWTLRAEGQLDAERIRRLLGDLPVEVAPDMTFQALG